MIHLCRRQSENVVKVAEALYRGSSDEGELDCDVTTQSSEEEEEEELMEEMTRGPSPTENADDAPRQAPQDLRTKIDASPKDEEEEEEEVSTSSPRVEKEGSDVPSGKATPVGRECNYYETETPVRVRGSNEIVDIPRAVRAVPPELRLREAERGVWARERIPRGTRYGPFLGKWVHEPIDERFAWERAAAVGSGYSAWKVMREPEVREKF